MARKPRDHKAEYQRRKQLARQRGYHSVRKYKRARKIAGIKRNESLVDIRTIRQDNKEWSDAHSRVQNSKWNPRLSDTKALKYHEAFVIERPNGEEKLAALHDYLVEYDLVTDEEWEENYLPSK